jgi:hypothetical protein
MLMGGDEGRALAEQSAAAMEAAGVRAPIRYARLLVPGAFGAPV